MQVVVPQEIEPVNGSTVDMGCTGSLVHSDGVMVCGGCSYLTDSVSPDIDTSTSDWASQLVTVKRNEGTPDFNHPHVLLTFGFGTAVSLTGIEMDLFLCPDWNIGAPSIFVIVNPDYNLTQFDNVLSTAIYPERSSCDSLSTVTNSGDVLQAVPYHTVHILVDLTLHQSIEWVHVGEVRFIPTSSFPLTPSSTLSLPPLCKLSQAPCSAHTQLVQVN